MILGNHIHAHWKCIQNVRFFTECEKKNWNEMSEYETERKMKMDKLYWEKQYKYTAHCLIFSYVNSKYTYQYTRSAANPDGLFKYTYPGKITFSTHRAFFEDTWTVAEQTFLFNSSISPVCVYYTKNRENGVQWEKNYIDRDRSMCERVKERETDKVRDKARESIEN